MESGHSPTGSLPTVRPYVVPGRLMQLDRQDATRNQQLELASRAVDGAAQGSGLNHAFMANHRHIGHAINSVGSSFHAIQTAATNYNPNVHTGSGLTTRKDTEKYSSRTTAAAVGLAQMQAAQPATEGQSHPDEQPQAEPENAASIVPWQDQIPQISTSARPLFAPSNEFPNAENTRVQHWLKAAKNADPDGLKEIIERVQSEAARALNRTNYFTEKKHRHTVNVWYNILRESDDTLKDEDMWKSAVVHSKARFFLRMRTEITPGTRGGHIKAITLQNWLSSLVYCIAEFTHLPDANRTKDGWRLLIEQNLYHDIKQETSQIIEDYKLDRYQPDKEYWGPSHVLLMIQYALDKSKNPSTDERLVAIMHSGYLSLLLVLLCRPGSISPSCKRYLDQGLYAKAGDLRWHIRTTIDNAEMEICLYNYKGFNADKGKKQWHKINPMTKAHNIPLEPSPYFLTLFQELGMFGLTNEEFENYGGAFLKVLPEFENAPLICGVTHGGRKLTRDTVATARGLAAKFHDLAQGAGLPVGSPTALRRGGAETLALTSGLQCASMALGHAQNTHSVLQRFYIRGTHSIPLAELILEETHGRHTDETTMISRRMHDSTSAVVDALMSYKPPELHIGKTVPKGATSQRRMRMLSDEGKAKVADDAELKRLEQEWEIAWDKLHSLIDPSDTNALSYRRSLTNVHTICQCAKIKNGVPRIKFLEQIAVIKQLADQRTTRRRAVNKKTKRDEELKSLNSRCDPMRPENTPSARAEGLEAAKRLPEVVLRSIIQPSSSGSEVSASVSSSEPAAPRASEPETQPLPPLSHTPARPIDYTLPQEAETSEFSAEKAQRVREQILQRIEQLGLTITDPELNLVGLDESHEEEVAKDFIGYMNIIEKGCAEASGQPSTPSSNLPTVRYGLNKEKRMHKGKEVPLQPADVILSESPDDVPSYYDDNFMDDKNEPDLFHLPVSEVRRQWRKALIEPHRKSTEKREKAKGETGTIICERCKAFTHVPGADKKDWRTASALNKHMLQKHTRWSELELQMVTPDSHLFKCPGQGCSATSNTVAKLRNHMVSSRCPDQAIHASLKTEHLGSQYKDKKPLDGGPVKRRGQRAKDMESQLEHQATSDGDSDSVQILRTPVITQQQTQGDTVADPIVLPTSPSAPSPSGSLGSPYLDSEETPLHADDDSELPALQNIEGREDDPILMRAIHAFIENFGVSYDRDELLSQAEELGYSQIADHQRQRANIADVLNEITHPFDGSPSS